VRAALIAADGKQLPLRDPSLWVAGFKGDAGK